MNVLRRIGGLILGFIALVLLVTLGVVNRQPVRMKLDPFRPEDPAIWLDLPLYLFLFGALIIGALLGGGATWLSQGKWRRMVRQRTQDSLRWRGEAERLLRERDAGLAGAPEKKKPLALARR